MHIRIQCLLSISVLALYSESVSSQDIATENVLTDVNTQNSSNDATEERSTRCTPGSKRTHLRKHDAHQVAQYFINGGPLIGHSHFRDAKGTEIDPDESGPLGMPSIPHLNYGHPIHSIGAPHAPNIYPHHMYGYSHSHPLSSPYYPHNPYSHTGSNILLNTQPGIPHTPYPDGLLGSALNQQPQSVGNGFYTPHSSILRIPVLNTQAGSNPVVNEKEDDEDCEDDENAPSVGAAQPSSTPEVKSSNAVFEALIPHIPNQVHGFPQSYYTPYNPYHPQPIGYILRLIPHNTNVTPSNKNTDEPTAGASETEQEEASSDDEAYEDAQDEPDNDSSDKNNSKREEPAHRILKSMGSHSYSERRPRSTYVSDHSLS